MIPSPSSQAQANEKESFLKELRMATAVSHKRLEEIPLSQLLVSPGITMEAYASYLSHMYSFVSAFEQSAFPLLKTYFPDIESRRRSQLIANDLEFIEKTFHIQKKLSRADLESDLSLPYALGCMYVVEGSSLGGKVIYKNISSHLPLNAGQGASYFFGYGAETGRMWASFLDKLCEEGIKPGNTEAVLQGADKTFQAIYDILSRPVEV